MSASTSKKNGKKDTKAPSGQMDPQAQLREIQDLLFGQQVAEVRQSIDLLTEQNKKQFSEMDKKINQSMKELKSHFDKELNDLTKHVNKLGDAADNRSAVIESDISLLQTNLENFQKQTDTAHESLEALLFAEIEKLAAEMDAKYQELSENLGQASGDLSDQKVGREALAQLLVDMANTLENEPG